MSEVGDVDIIATMDAQARELLNFSNRTTVATTPSGEEAPPVDIKDRIKAFEAVTAYLVVRKKIAPDEGASNGIERYQRQLNGGSRASRRRAAPSAPPAGGDTPGDPED